MEALNRNVYNGSLLPESIVGAWEGTSANCPYNGDDMTGCDFNNPYASTLTIEAVSMDFEEPSGTLKHTYFTDYPTLNGVLYFRRWRVDALDMAK